MSYRKILLPLDGSENALLAARHAVELASALSYTGGTSLVLLYCYGEIPASIGGSARVEVIAESEGQGRDILSPAAGLCREAGLDFCERIAAGAPGRTIVQIAAQEGCDLIVMGSRGLSDFSGMVMGSVSHRVLRHAVMPVLIVR